jgi:hypothetical protein
LCTPFAIPRPNSVANPRIALANMVCCFTSNVRAECSASALLPCTLHRHELHLWPRCRRTQCCRISRVVFLPFFTNGRAASGASASPRPQLRQHRASDQHHRPQHDRAALLLLENGSPYAALQLHLSGDINAMKLENELKFLRRVADAEASLDGTMARPCCYRFHAGAGGSRRGLAPERAARRCGRDARVWCGPVEGASLGHMAGCDEGLLRGRR